MHLIFGLAGLFGLLWYVATTGQGQGFSGLIHPPAMLLLGLGPLLVALVSYRPEHLMLAARAVARAVRFQPARSRERVFDELTRFAAELKGRRLAAALEVSEASGNALLRQLAPLVVKQFPPEAIESSAVTATSCLASTIKRAEAVPISLARISPAIGLIGTVLGLVNLLKDLSNFERLGPSMALALLCTFYGLVLANAVYQPLAKQVHSYAAVSVEEARLVTRALVLFREGRSMADVRALFEVAGGPGDPDAALASAQVLPEVER